MAESKYGKYILTELKAPPDVMAGLERYRSFGKRILWMDANNTPGAFQMNCSWYLGPTTGGPQPHAHDVDEIVGFFSGDPNNPHELGGKIEFWVGDNPVVIDKSAYFFFPAGMKHSPLILREINRPVFHFSVVTGHTYETTDGSKSPKVTDPMKYVVTELKEPEDKIRLAPVYNKYARRILWMDENVVPGAFHFNASWYLKASETVDDKPHVHAEDEIIGFCGGDPENEHDLNGEVEIYLGDEKHTITRSAMIFVPAGLPHCPLTLRRVDRPIFHFTTVLRGRYIKDENV
jgi:hypothetical protein